MEQIAFVMQLNAGQKQEYKKRHDALWPELKNLLLESGIRDYSIFLDDKTKRITSYNVCYTKLLRL